MYDDDRDDYCPECGDYLDIEVNVFVQGPGRYIAHCSCTDKARKEREREETLRQRYDFRGGGCRDKTYETPTLGDLLKKSLG
jgi:hypothetical protein